MKPSVLRKMMTIGMVLGLAASNAGCFIATHDPALNRGVVTTTTRAELDGGNGVKAQPGPRPSPRTPNAVEINDLSQDAR